jgi:hypothetical protein
MEKEYVIIYTQYEHGCNECGVSDVNTLFLDNEVELHKKANEILKENKIIVFSGVIKTSFQYKPISEVTRYQPITKNQNQ